MKRMSFFKRLRLYRYYKSVIKGNAAELQKNFGIRIDRANRLYTVLNVPSDNIGEAYNLKKSDIDKIAEGYIKDFSAEIAKYLDSKGLKEMYDFYNIEKVDKYSYLIVFGPNKDKIIDSEVYTKNLYYRILPISVVVLLVLFLILFLR
jgi:hypothetical protein